MGTAGERTRLTGYREGEAAGRRQASAALEPVTARLTHAIEGVASVRSSIARDAECELVELALAIARRVLHRELSVDPGALQGLVKAALEKLAGQEICRVSAHPELAEPIRQALEQQGRAGVNVVADGALERGAVVLQTAHGKVDASLETQLAEIGRGFADQLPGG